MRRNGRLIFADDVRLEGPIDSLLARPAVGGEGRAIGTVLHIAPGAKALADAARIALQGARAECGASVFDAMMVARFVSSDAQDLRTDLIRFIEWLRGRPMPRTWQT